jgi:hypothetical protein
MKSDLVVVVVCRKEEDGKGEVGEEGSVRATVVHCGCWPPPPTVGVAVATTTISGFGGEPGGVGWEPPSHPLRESLATRPACFPKQLSERSHIKHTNSSSDDIKQHTRLLRSQIKLDTSPTSSSARQQCKQGPPSRIQEQGKQQFFRLKNMVLP